MASRPMAISRQSFERLLAIVEQFPQDILLDLMPTCRVWGSILYHSIIIREAVTYFLWNWPLQKTFRFAGFEQVKAGIIKWPMSVLRFWLRIPEDLINLADKIFQEWRQYSDSSVQILAERQTGHHLTPSHQ